MDDPLIDTDTAAAVTAGLEPLVLEQARRTRSTPLTDAATGKERRFRGMTCFPYLNGGGR
jgi:hypothetical protein